MAKLTYKKVYDTLSQINVNEHTEEKMGLTYLSWSQAVRIFTENFPEWNLKWHGANDANGVLRDVVYYEGGTASVTCSVTIPDGDGGELKKEMWLPITDFKNEAIVHPDSMAINTAKMRCLTKNLAMWGLGLYVYSGLDDIFYEAPSKATANGVSKPKKKSSSKKPVQTNKKADDQVDEKIVILKKTIHDLAKGGWSIEDKDLQSDIKKAITDRNANKVVTLTENIQALGQQALQLSEEK